MSGHRREARRWTRDGLSRRDTIQVQTHLDRCARCRELAAELADLNSGLRTIAIAVLGPAAIAYLAATRTATASATATTAGAAGAATVLPHQFAGVGVSVATLATAGALTHQNSALVYQGSITVPDLCGGGALRLNHGGTFSATLT